MKHEIYASVTSTQKKLKYCAIFASSFFTVQGYFEHTDNLQEG